MQGCKVYRLLLAVRGMMYDFVKAMECLPPDVQDRYMLMFLAGCRGKSTTVLQFVEAASLIARGRRPRLLEMKEAGACQ